MLPKSLLSSEGNEPIHLHASKGDAECKYWLKPEFYEIEEAWSHNLTPRLRREVRKIIFDHFDLIVPKIRAIEWNDLDLLQSYRPIVLDARRWCGGQEWSGLF
jgi:hypothetical protein